MKRIIGLLLVLVTVSTITSCFFEPSIGFEKINNTNYSDKVKFYCINDLLWVIDRDKLFCVDPNNGQPLEFVELPGIPIDSVASMVESSYLSMTFKTNEGYIYKDYICSNKEPYIKENKTMSVDGSLLVKIDCSNLDKVFILQNESKTTLSYYENYKLVDKITFDKKMLVESLNTNILFAAYDGKILNYIGFKKGKFVQNFHPTGYNAPFSWGILTDDFDKCLLSTNMDLILLYNGKSIYRIELFFDTKMAKTIDMPSEINSITRGSSMFHLLGCQDGVYLLDDLKQDPIRIIDEALMPLGDTYALGLSGGDFSIAGNQTGDGYKIVGIKSNQLYNDNNSTKPLQPTIVGFDNLPKRTYSAGIANENDGFRIYAFTSEGLFKSDEIFHDDLMEKFRKEPAK